MDSTIVSSTEAMIIPSTISTVVTGRDVIKRLESPKSSPFIEELGDRSASVGSITFTPVTPTDVGMTPRTDARTDAPDNGRVFSHELGNSSRTKRYSSTDRRSPNSKQSSRRHRSNEEVRRARSRGSSEGWSPKKRTSCQSRSKCIEDIDNPPVDGPDHDLGRVSEPFLENRDDVDCSASVDPGPTFAHTERTDDTTKRTPSTFEGDMNNSAPIIQFHPATSMSADDNMNNVREGQDSSESDDIIEHEGDPESESHKSLVELYHDLVQSLTDIRTQTNLIQEGLDQQDRDLEHYTEDADTRHDDIDAFNRHFVRIFKTFEIEARRVRVARREKKMSADILSEDHAEIPERIRALIESVTQLEARKEISLDEFKEEIEQIEFSAEEANAENEVAEEELDEVRKRLNTLKIDLMLKRLSGNDPGPKRIIGGLPDGLLVDIRPPPILWMDTLEKEVTSDLDNEGNMSARAFLNPHEVITSKTEAISTMHWLRCCKTRFTKPTGIPGPEYFLSHGAIRYSERYTVNINKPAHIELNTAYIRVDWLPSKSDLQKRPYISDLVKHRIISREEQAVSRLHWVRCCRFRFMTETDIPAPVIATLKGVVSGESSSAGKKRKKAVKSKINTGLCPSTRKLPMKTNGSDMKPSHLLPPVCTFDQSGNATLEIRHRKTNMKNAKSRIDTGLGSNLKVFSSLSPILECDESESDTLETRHRRSNIKNVKSRIDTGLLANTKRLPPITINRNTDTARRSTSPRYTSDDRVCLSPFRVLPSIGTSKATTRNEATASNAVQNVTKVTKKAMPPLSGKNKQPPDGKIKQKAPGKKADAYIEARNGHLPPLKKYPTSPVRIESSLSARASLSPLPSIRSEASDSDERQCCHFDVRLSSSSDFRYDIMRNDYY